MQQHNDTNDHPKATTHETCLVVSVFTAMFFTSAYCEKTKETLGCGVCYAQFVAEMKSCLMKTFGAVFAV